MGDRVGQPRRRLHVRVIAELEPEHFFLPQRPLARWGCFHKKCSDVHHNRCDRQLLNATDHLEPTTPPPPSLYFHPPARPLPPYPTDWCARPPRTTPPHSWP